MRDRCDAGMRRACVHGCDAKCHVTGQYGTERKSHQDTGINPSVPNAAEPVDNRVPEFYEIDGNRVFGVKAVS